MRFLPLSQFQGTSGNRTQGFRFTWSSPNSSVSLLSSGPYASISAGSMAMAGQVYVLTMRVFSGTTMTSKRVRKRHGRAAPLPPSTTDSQLRRRYHRVQMIR